MLAQRRDQAELVEGRRAQVVDGAADGGHGAAHLVAEPAGERGEVGVARQLPGQPLELQRHAGELGTDAVVQVVPQPAALLLPAGDDPLAAGLQVGGQGRGPDQGGGPAGGVVEGGPLGPPPALAGVPVGDREPADVLAQGGQRPLVDVAGQPGVAGRADRRQPRIGGHDRDTGQPQHPGHLVGQRLQRLGGGGGGVQRRPEPGGDGERVAPLAVEQPVDRPLGPFPAGRGGERGERGQRDGDPALAGGELAEAGRRPRRRRSAAGRTGR